MLWLHPSTSFTPPSYSIWQLRSICYLFESTTQIWPGNTVPMFINLKIDMSEWRQWIPWRQIRGKLRNAIYSKLLKERHHRGSDGAPLANFPLFQ
jgi:hypothetical protein